MVSKELIEIAQSQLERILNFFPKVDAKASVMLGIDMAMLGLLALNIPTFKNLNWYMLIALIPLALLTLSLWYLYKQAFPNLDGGKDSLIYFREIATRTEHNYLKEFSAQTEESLVEEILSQVWRNSEILKEKFDCLKKSFILFAWSVIPWLIALALFVSKNLQLKIY